MAATTVISVSNLGKAYRLGGRERHRNFREAFSAMLSFSREQAAPESTLWALKDVSFQVRRGEVVGIIGRNGAGKSTLLKVLSRITRPTEGLVRIHGRVGSLLEVGTGFHHELTGRENIFLNGAILGMRRAEIARKFDEIVAFAEVERFLDTPVKHYSSGMYMRLAFAVAAHLEPEILIVDEVLAVGDAQFQKKCLGKMGAVASGGRTVLFVSHNMQAVRRLCSRAFCMEKGKAIFFNDVEGAIAHYSADLSVSVLDFDLERVPRYGGHGIEARLVRARLAENCNFRFNQPLELIITVRCSSPVSRAMIGVGFDTSDGNRILTLDSDSSGKLLDLSAGETDVRISIERNPLHPGVYAPSFGILCQDRVLDAVSGFATAICTADAEDYIESRGWGACRLPVSVTTQIR
ncbi:MAG TPA: ABC transporter ATP-binding protein [Planctomycetota bacterium]|nr:ABC transporter ATP-binding protein [Planctomycetota bacterium]